MNYFDDELKIIEKVQNLETESVLLATSSDEEAEVFQSIYNSDKWKDWINSSGKSDPPPDFYNDRLGFMMDVMRIDDHAFVNKDGKIINPTNMRESKIQKEIKQSGILDVFPNVKSIMVNAITDLPTNEDHNYSFYLNNFRRVVMQHNESIGLYRKNHPGYKTIFLVFDESSGYIESESLINQHVIKGYPHYWFADQAFVEVIKRVSADFIFWFAPFKYYELLSEQNFPELPQACIFSLKNLSKLIAKPIKYEANLMRSAEK